MEMVTQTRTLVEDRTVLMTSQGEGATQNMSLSVEEGELDGQGDNDLDVGIFFEKTLNEDDFEKTILGAKENGSRMETDSTLTLSTRGDG